MIAYYKAMAKFASGGFRSFATTKWGWGHSSCERELWIAKKQHVKCVIIHLFIHCCLSCKFWLLSLAPTSMTSNLSYGAPHFLPLLLFSFYPFFLFHAWFLYYWYLKNDAYAYTILIVNSDMTWQCPYIGLRSINRSHLDRTLVDLNQIF